MPPSKENPSETSPACYLWHRRWKNSQQFVYTAMRRQPSPWGRSPASKFNSWEVRSVTNPSAARASKGRIKTTSKTDILLFIKNKRIKKLLKINYHKHSAFLANYKFFTIYCRFEALEISSKKFLKYQAFLEVQNILI